MRADRLLSIMFMLQAQGKITTHELAEKLEVSRRTILRDIDALSIAGVPIHADAGHGGGVYLDEHYRVSLTGLSETEVQALFIATYQRPLHDVGLGQAAHATLLKLFATLPSIHQHEAERMQQRILLDPEGWWHKGKPLSHLEALKKAVLGDYRVGTIYERGDGTISERILEPYSLVAKASVWYLIARRDDELRMYRVSRFISVEVTDERFERNSDFNLAEYWESQVSSFVNNMPSFAFRLRLNSSRLPFLKLYASERYTVQETSDDETILTIEIQFSSLDEARMLVLGLGADAEIIEPEILRNAVLLQAQQLVTHLSHD